MIIWARTASSAGDPTGQLVLLGRVTVSLLVVLVLIVVGARLLRRTQLGLDGGLVRVRSRVGLTREAHLAVVEVGEQVLVLGVTASSVTLVSTLDVAALPEDPLVTERANDSSPGPRDPGWLTSSRRTIEALRDRTTRR